MAGRDTRDCPLQSRRWAANVGDGISDCDVCHLECCPAVADEAPPKQHDDGILRHGWPVAAGACAMHPVKFSGHAAQHAAQHTCTVVLWIGATDTMEPLHTTHAHAVIHSPSMRAATTWGQQHAHWARVSN